MRRIAMSVQLLNALLTPISGGRRHPDRAWDKLVAQAVANSGGAPDGDKQFIEDFRHLLNCVANVDGLSPLGWQSITTDLRIRLENRLRVSRRLQERPEIADEQITSPVFIVGLPRTASTLAHRILAQSAENRAPLLWELYATDVSEVGDKLQAQRIKAVQRMASSMDKLAPMFKFIHPLAADRPEECLYVLPHGVSYLARVLMPDYRKWIDQRDYLDDYLYLKQVLQVLQHGRPQQRWVLKNPPHLHNLDVLLRVFPDATIVWTHRDPATVMGSLCSLVETSMSLHVRHPDLHGIGAMWLELLAQSIEKGRKARVNAPAGAFVDVAYDQLAGEPQTGVPRLYGKLGMNWTDADAANLDSVLARPTRDRMHEYSLSRYGLTVDGVHEAFGDYPTLVATINS